jgi:CRISPR-associated protein Csd1
LTPHHLKTLERERGVGLRIIREKELGNCLTVIGETFPKTQNMEEQGSFILGYYQQNSKLYEKKEKEIELNGTNDNGAK